jgi:hypothetical protein
MFHSAKRHDGTEDGFTCQGAMAKLEEAVSLAAFPADSVIQPSAVKTASAIISLDKPRSYGKRDGLRHVRSRS